MGNFQKAIPMTPFRPLGSLYYPLLHHEKEKTIWELHEDIFVLLMTEKGTRTLGPVVLWQQNPFFLRRIAGGQVVLCI